MKHKIYLLCILAIITSLLSGCNKTDDTETYLSQTTFLLDTVVTIQLYDTDNEELLSQAIALCAEYEALLSRTIETSEISQINSAEGNYVTVSDETLALLELGIYYCDLSGGNFDITIAPLSSLWNFTNEEAYIPNEEDLEIAASNVDYQTIEIDGNNVRLRNPDAMIDLGGIAKGYIADKIKEFLVSEGIEHAIINLGGNILTIGGHADGSNFLLGIQEPFSTSNTAITSVSISDQSLVSSGVYERYFELDGELYHHILDPRTGYPFETDLYSVSIISDSSVDGDALSTICITLGLEEGLELINSIDGIDAIFITDEMEIYNTLEP